MSDVRKTLKKLDLLEGKYFAPQVRGTEKAKKSKNGKHPFLGRLVGGESKINEGYEGKILSWLDEANIDAHFENGVLVVYDHNDVNRVEDVLMNHDVEMPEIRVEDESEYDQFNSDAEADADVLANAGMGTDEDYGYYGESVNEMDWDDSIDVIRPEKDQAYQDRVLSLLDKNNIDGHFSETGVLIVYDHNDVNRVEDVLMGTDLESPPMEVEDESEHSYGSDTWSHKAPAGESVNEESWEETKARLRKENPDERFDFDEPEEEEFYDGDKVVLKPDYAGNEAGEVFTVSQADNFKKKCWIGDKYGRGWYVRFSQIEPARKKKRVVGPRHPRGKVGEPTESLDISERKCKYNIGDPVIFVNDPEARGTIIARWWNPDENDMPIYTIRLMGGQKEMAEEDDIKRIKKKKSVTESINPDGWYVVDSRMGGDKIICGPHNSRREAEEEKSKASGKNLEVVQGRHVQMHNNDEFSENKEIDKVDEDFVRSMHRAWNDYLREKDEIGRHYKTLEDAGPSYAPGPNQVWYWKSDDGRDFMMGYDFLEKHGKLPTEKTLAITHVKIGTLQESNLERIYYMMQGEVWSPQGEAREMIKKSGSGHTSMSVGDVIKTPKGLFMVDRFGFKRLPNTTSESLEESNSVHLMGLNDLRMLASMKNPALYQKISDKFENGEMSKEEFHNKLKTISLGKRAEMDPEPTEHSIHLMSTGDLQSTASMRNPEAYEKLMRSYNHGRINDAVFRMLLIRICTQPRGTPYDQIVGEEKAQLESRIQEAAKKKGSDEKQKNDLLQNLLANSDVGFEGEDYHFDGDTVVANDVRTAGKILRAINTSALFSKQAVIVKKGEQPVIGFDPLEDAQTIFQDTIGPNDNQADVEVKTDTSGDFYLYINGKRSTRVFKNLAKTKKYITALDHQLHTHSALGQDSGEESEEE